MAYRVIHDCHGNHKARLAAWKQSLKPWGDIMRMDAPRHCPRQLMGMRCQRWSHGLTCLCEHIERNGLVRAVGWGLRDYQPRFVNTYHTDVNIPWDLKTLDSLFKFTELHGVLYAVGHSFYHGFGQIPMHSGALMLEMFRYDADVAVVRRQLKWADGARAKRVMTWTKGVSSRPITENEWYSVSGA